MSRLRVDRYSARERAIIRRAVAAERENVGVRIDDAAGRGAFDLDTGRQTAQRISERLINLSANVATWRSRLRAEPRQT